MKAKDAHPEQTEQDTDRSQRDRETPESRTKRLPRLHDSDPTDSLVGTDPTTKAPGQRFHWSGALSPCAPVGIRTPNLLIRR